MHIGHIAIWTDNLERLRDFYAKYFNCRISERYDNYAKHFSSYFLSFPEGAGIEIMKKIGLKDRKEDESFGLAHFAIVVGTKDQVDRLTNLLEKEGVTIESYPRVTGDGYYESVVLDPDGNKIELTALNGYSL